VSLKIELKPNERIIIGDCVVTNHDKRTNLSIDGLTPILREKDMMTPSQANSTAKCLYLALLFMYIARRPKDDYAIYQQLAQELVTAEPHTRPTIHNIDKCIATGEFYKALKEARKLVTYETKKPANQRISKAEANAVGKTVSQRELEARMLREAAAKLEAVYSSAPNGSRGLDDALAYNRRLWTIFIEAVSRKDNRLPLATRMNLSALGAFVMQEMSTLLKDQNPDHLTSIINVNRGIAAGLNGSASSHR
jgi:flagellar biosynthesis repressor protein FlbT